MTGVVCDSPQRRRYELEVDGGLAFIDYRREGQVVIMTHAEVPPTLRGGGVGAARRRRGRVRAALAPPECQ
jgi:predicted GNAT family acetyltransferase